MNSNPSSLIDKILFQHRNNTRIAINFLDKKISYKELWDCIQATSNVLCRRGLKSGDIVSISSERSIEFIILMFSVMACGAVALPNEVKSEIEVWSGNDFLSYANVSLKLARKRSRTKSINNHFFMRNRFIRIDFNGQKKMEKKQGVQPFVILKTSGTSQMPKLFFVNSGPFYEVLQFFSKNILDKYEIERVLGLASFNYDVAYFELFLTLLAGKQYCLYHRNLSTIGGRYLSEFISHNKINFVVLSPSVLSTLPKIPLISLKLMFLGGEPFCQKLVEYWIDQCDIYNAYGLAEANICSTVCKVEKSNLISLGVPVANTELHVVDNCGNIVRPGDTGELFLGGPYIYPNYLDKDLNKTYIIKDTLGQGNYLLKTGDMVKKELDGSLTLVGRKDDMIKINGERVYINKIATVIQSLPEVKWAHVIVEKRNHRNRLIVFYLTNSQRPLRERYLRNILCQHCHHKILPHDFIWIADLPVKESNKFSKESLSYFYKNLINPAVETVESL